MPKYHFKNDTEALLKLAEGNLSAYRFLFDHHFTDLCNFVLIYLHSKELSEEVALEIFTYIWEKRDTLEIRTTFKSYLFAAAKNKAISHYRKAQISVFTSLESSDHLGSDLSESSEYMETKELRELIEAAINKLPEKSREVYRLAWEENLSHKEIAGQLGITPKTVENHIGIALRKLRESLKPYYKQIFIVWIIQLFLD